MPSWQEAAVIEDLGPMLQAAHLRTEIFAYDHNWQEHPNDIASTPPDEAGDINDYPQQVLATPAARWISGVAFHCYYGDPSAMTAFHNEYPKLQIFMDECSGSQSADPADTFSDTLKWHSRNLEIGSTRNWSSIVINWNLALDPTGGPHVGGCGTCTGIVTVGPGDTVTPDAEYYALGQLSRFVQPGAVRIASTSFGTTGWNGEVDGRRVPEPGWLDRAGRAQRERQRAGVCRPGRPAAVYLHAARRLAGHLRLERRSRAAFAPEAGQPRRLDRYRQPQRAHRPVLLG